jgi:hypothetical protein
LDCASAQVRIALARAMTGEQSRRAAFHSFYCKETEFAPRTQWPDV